MDTIERTLDSWELTTDPIRPSEADLAHMTAEIRRRFANPRVLILGMTPELIDMAHQLGAERIVVMELRLLGLNAYRRLVKAPFEAINGDWRVFHPAYANSFDVILGHGPFIFLVFPDEWIATLGVVRRYLTRGGVMIMRHFHVPAAGYPFLMHYERLLREFEARTKDEGETVRTREFLKTVTSLRCSAILGATQEDGVVDQFELDRLMQHEKHDIARRYGSEKIWQRMHDEFDYPTAAGYGSVRPLAAPRLHQVRQVLERGGLCIEDVRMIGAQPTPECFSFITGTFDGE
jgi:hypothetical protein